MTTDYYEVLGVPSTASQDDVKRAYKNLAKRFHPDKSTGDSERFKHINEAYEVLNDEHKRRNYDQFGDADYFPPTADPLQQIFQAMFASQTKHVKMVDTVTVNIPLQYVLDGGAYSVTYDVHTVCSKCKGHGATNICDITTCYTCRGVGMITQQLGPFAMTTGTCPSCFGRKQVIKDGKQCSACDGKKSVKVKRSTCIDVPVGFKQGHRIVLKSRGNYNHHINEHNDLLLVLAYDLPPNTRVGGDQDLVCTLTVSLAELMCGFHKQLSLYGDAHPVSVRTRGYIDPTRQYTIKSMGLIHNSRRGDLILSIVVDYPKDVGERIIKYRDVFLKMFKLHQPPESSGDFVLNPESD